MGEDLLKAFKSGIPYFIGAVAVWWRPCHRRMGLRVNSHHARLITHACRGVTKWPFALSYHLSALELATERTRPMNICPSTIGKPWFFFFFPTGSLGGSFWGFQWWDREMNPRSKCWQHWLDPSSAPVCLCNERAAVDTMCLSCPQMHSS